MTYIRAFFLSSLALFAQVPNEAKFRLRGQEAFTITVPTGLHQVAGTKALCSLQNEKGTTQITIATGPKVKGADAKEGLKEFASVFEKLLLGGMDKKFTFASGGDFEVTAQGNNNKRYRITYSKYTWPVAQVDKEVVLAIIAGDKYFYTYSFFHLDESDKTLGMQILRSLIISPDSVF